MDRADAGAVSAGEIHRNGLRPRSAVPGSKCRFECRAAPGIPFSFAMRHNPLSTIPLAVCTRTLPTRYNAPAASRDGLSVLPLLDGSCIMPGLSSSTGTRPNDVVPGSVIGLGRQERHPRAEKGTNWE